MDFAVAFFFKFPDQKNLIQIKMELVIIYLYFVSFIALFRTIMYFVAQPEVARNKVTSITWDIPQGRELALRYSYLIRLFMSFKAIIFFYTTYLEKKSDQEMIAFISFLYDLYVLILMINDKITKQNKIKKRSAMAPSTNIAITIQSIITGSYIVYRIMSFRK